MVANGTKRLCQGGDHKVVWDTTPAGGHWYHEKKTDWADRPHKAAPKKHKRKVTNANEQQERET